MNYRNFYECECGEKWEDVWSCMCDDRCPRCDTSVSPVASEEIAINTNANSYKI